jgi:AcrR family transcriptional regulator
MFQADYSGEDPCVGNQVGPGRPRLQETDQRINQAVLDLLHEHGTRAVSIDAVAARSGVARTTIYRRYRNRSELVGAALSDLIHGPASAPDLALPEKLRWVLEQIGHLLEALGPGGVGAVLDDSDPEFTAVLRGLVSDRLDALQVAMAVDVEAGRLGPHLDADSLVGLLFGAALGEVFRFGEAREGWLDRTADLLARTAVGR